jgi:NADH:ubiquinone oxidoreductase subunit 5 (subunit L)/multisubunit Na+/H+ antiporter MnhA subunit
VLAGVFVTAFYSFRMYFLVFHGKERFDQNPDAHHARMTTTGMAMTTTMSRTSHPGW